MGFIHWHLRAQKSDGNPPLLVMFKGDIWQAVILAQHFLIFDPIFFRYPVSRRNTDWKDISSHHVAVNAKKKHPQKKNNRNTNTLQETNTSHPTFGSSENHHLEKCFGMRYVSVPRRVKKKPRTQMIQMIHIFEDLTHEIQPPKKIRWWFQIVFCSPRKPCGNDAI